MKKPRVYIEVSQSILRRDPGMHKIPKEDTQKRPRRNIEENQRIHRRDPEET